MSHYVMNYHDCWADLRKAVKVARTDYLKKVERATPYLPSEKAQEDIERAKADYEAALESARGAARPRFARAIEGMKERIAAPDMTAPTQDMLSILTMLNMRDDIEAGEIEAAASALDGVTSCAAVYDSNNDKIILVYEGKKREITEILSELRLRLPEYMMPQIVKRIKSMPHNANGKIDRKKILEEI